MPISFAVYASSRLVVYTVEGTPTSEERQEFFEGVTADPDFECGFNFLGDYRDRSTDPDPAYVRALAREVRSRAQQLGPCRWAMIVRTARGFASTQLCGVLTYGSWVEFAPFMSPAEAADWVKAGTAERRALSMRC